jgi:hypothetical protein
MSVLCIEARLRVRSALCSGRFGRKYIAGPLSALTITLAVSLAMTSAASAGPPQPCEGARHVVDGVGDGHHVNTDVIAAWVAEDAGSVKAVIQAQFAVWSPEHEDSDHAGFALLYRIGGLPSDGYRYLRAQAWRSEPISYDFGSWTAAGGFAREGFTTGSTTAGSGGAVVIDFDGQPLPKGSVLSRLHVLTYDGIETGAPHWVDRAPGGTTPGGSQFGADFVVGACGADPDDPGAPTGTTGVVLGVPAYRTGAGRVPVTGSVQPAEAGVSLSVEAVTRGGGSRTFELETGPEGGFHLPIRLRESTTFRATALDSQISSRSVSVTVRCRLRIRVHKFRRGRAVSGWADPALPGRVLLLRPGSVYPLARKQTDNGRFRFRVGDGWRGQVEAVYIPTGARAERAVSNKGNIK